MSLYFCAGHPTLSSTLSILQAIQQGGIDMVEVGIPFSDPMADGPVIQQATTTALRNGMSLRLLFSQLANLRKDIHIPVILMGYFNPIYRYGIEAFFAQCEIVGIDGVIIPDLPFSDYRETIQPVADKYDVKVIMLITPETSEARIREIDAHTSGFIYMVSSASTTGAQKSYGQQTADYFARVNAMHLRNPRLVGFGISNKATLEDAQKASSGAIVGSKFVSLLQNNEGAPEQAVKDLIETLSK